MLCQHTASDALRRHCLGVEACLRWYAERLGANPDDWGLAGLLHDFDYEMHPDEHPLWGIALLETQGAPEWLTRAIASHYAAKTGVQPESDLEKHLFACDELSGFVTAVTFVRPARSVHEVEVPSVLKKLKTPSFAAGVSRDDVHAGTALIGLPLEEHVGNVILAMRSQAEALGLAGQA